MKTKDELTKVKNEYDALNGKLAELNEEELSYVSGGAEDHNVMLESLGLGDDSEPGETPMIRIRGARELPPVTIIGEDE